MGGTACNGSIHASINLDYDLASNVTRRVETLTGSTFAGTCNYTYDEANRLKTVAGPAAFGSRTYDYDGGGNRSVQVNSNPAITTTYNAASLPVSSSDGTTYSHDQVGDLTAIDRSGGSNDWFFSYSSWKPAHQGPSDPVGRQNPDTSHAALRSYS